MAESLKMLIEWYKLAASGENASVRSGQTVRTADKVAQSLRRSSLLTADPSTKPLLLSDSQVLSTTEFTTH